MRCGHRCPSLCGEVCPDGYCQACDQHLTNRVDLLELKDYRDIDLDASPIVVLGCGHIFTAESLDGLVLMNEVYVQDPMTGGYTNLCSTPASLAVPRCPDCKRQIRQFATKRYGRSINQAVMDEIARKFHIQGLKELAELERRVQEIGEKMRDYHLSSASTSTDTTLRTSSSGKLKKDIDQFCRKMCAEQQPTKKLVDAIRLAKMTDYEALVNLVKELTLENETLTAPILDKQIILGGTLAGMKLSHVILSTELAQASRVRCKLSEETEKEISTLLHHCGAFVHECQNINLFRMAVQGVIAYARLAKFLESYSRAIPPSWSTQSIPSTKYTNNARDLLKLASEMCKVAFENVGELRMEVEEISRLYERERYEPVTADEIASIKSAMVNGAAGIATHSGHWYRCQNGHSVRENLQALGEIR
jgi:hypothetical protein